MKKTPEAYRDGVRRSSCGPVPEVLNKITDIVLNYRPKAKQKARKTKRATRHKP